MGTGAREVSRVARGCSSSQGEPRGGAQRGSRAYSSSRGSLWIARKRSKKEASSTISASAVLCELGRSGQE